MIVQDFTQSAYINLIFSIIGLLYEKGTRLPDSYSFFRLDLQFIYGQTIM